VPPVALPDSAADLAMNVSIFKQNLEEAIEAIASSGGEVRDVRVREAARVAITLRRLLSAHAEAASREAKVNRQRRQAEEQRQQLVADELNECSRLRRIVLGLDS
jgi:hypothetical protein